MHPLRPVRIETYAYRVPLAEPVRNAFGLMRTRAALAVRLEDASGAHGWGEVFSNWPPDGAEHRAALIEEVLAPLAIGREFASPEALADALTARTRVLVLQTDEPGPFAQAIAGLDIAAWDLVARRAGIPLARMLEPRAPLQVPAYASGIDPTAPGRVGAACLAEGHRAFKLKVGFGDDRDCANLAELREAVGEAATLMVDANQAWDIERALAMAERLAPLQPAWLEEPLPADTRIQVWRSLARGCPVALAAGENLRGDGDFDSAIASGAFRYLQPDAIKWGGVSGTLRIARRIVAAGLDYCPHYLGGGIGLLASAHLLAAVGGGGLLEVDANPNPLRERLGHPLPSIEDGTMRLGEAPGLGVEPDLAALAPWRRGVRV